MFLGAIGGGSEEENRSLGERMGDMGPEVIRLGGAGGGSEEEDGEEEEEVPSLGERMGDMGPDVTRLGGAFGDVMSGEDEEELKEEESPKERGKLNVRALGERESSLWGSKEASNVIDREGEGHSFRVVERSSLEGADPKDVDREWDGVEGFLSCDREGEWGTLFGCSCRTGGEEGATLVDRGDVGLTIDEEEPKLSDRERDDLTMLADCTTYSVCEGDDEEGDDDGKEGASFCVTGCWEGIETGGEKVAWFAREGGGGATLTGGEIVVAAVAAIVVVVDRAFDSADFVRMAAAGGLTGITSGAFEGETGATEEGGG